MRAICLVTFGRDVGPRVQVGFDRLVVRLPAPAATSRSPTSQSSPSATRSAAAPASAARSEFHARSTTAPVIQAINLSALRCRERARGASRRRTLEFRRHSLQALQRLHLVRYDGLFGVRRHARVFVAELHPSDHVCIKPGRRAERRSRSSEGNRTTSLRREAPWSRERCYRDCLRWRPPSRALPDPTTSSAGSPRKTRGSTVRRLIFEREEVFAA